MSNRDARPLSEKAMSAMHDACIEEIEQGLERFGIPCLLTLHTGFRRNVVKHYTDSWRTTHKGREAIQTPKKVKCTLTEGGCHYCNMDRSRGPDGYMKPKTGQSEQRTVPIFSSWGDYHRDEERDTEIIDWLNHWSKTNTDQGWGYHATNRLNRILKSVAKRRMDTIADNHQGKEIAYACGNDKETVPDIIFHDLRATWCTQCIRAGVKENQVRDWGGWKSVEMVEHYRGFVDDPEGTERDKYESIGGGDDQGGDSDIDMTEVYEVYSAITEGRQVNPTKYDNAVLEAAYEMVDAG